MDSQQMELLFNTLSQGSNEIPTNFFLQTIQELGTIGQQELNEIGASFDPHRSGVITWDRFKHGIHKVYESIVQIQDLVTESPVEPAISPSSSSSSSSSAQGQSEGIGESSVDSLLSFDSITDSDSLFNEKPPFNDHHVKYSDELTLPDCISHYNELVLANNMSVLEPATSNDNFVTLEEHFEFTPSSDQLKKEVDDADEDFSFSNGDSSYNSLKSATFHQRNTWLRSSVVKRNGSSLKRNSSLGPYTSSPICAPNERSNSRRSSISYESDEMNADANLEEDVQNLNDKLKKLQEQVEILNEAQKKNEIKYTNMKRENINLNDKIGFLEEHIRDIEIQSDQRKQEDEQRYKDSMARLEREKSQELENYVNRIIALQKELFEAKEDSKRYQQMVDSLQFTKSELEAVIQDKESEIELLKVDIQKLRDTIRQQEKESYANSTLIEALNQELTINRQTNDAKVVEHQKLQENEVISHINAELENQLRLLKQENRSLKESNEELTAQLLNNHLIEGKSLLKEGEAISSLANEISDLNNEQLKTALKEQQDVNAKLRAYIDGILLNIVENYPQLLEVKPQ